MRSEIKEDPTRLCKDLIICETALKSRLLEVDDGGVLRTPKATRNYMAYVPAFPFQELIKDGLMTREEMAEEAAAGCLKSTNCCTSTCGIINLSTTENADPNRVSDSWINAISLASRGSSSHA